LIRSLAISVLPAPVGATRRIVGARGKFALDLLDGGPLEWMQDDAGNILLIIFRRLGICVFDRAAKPIYF
jgi:hypothetical protein